MAERTSRRQARSPLDTSNPANWTAKRFVDELEKIGILVPSSLSKAVLKSIFMENAGRSGSSCVDSAGRMRETNFPRSNARAGRPSCTAPENQPPQESVDDGHGATYQPTGTRLPTEQGLAESHVSSGSTQVPSPIQAETGSIGTGVIQSMLSTMSSMQQAMLGLQSTVTALQNKEEPRGNTLSSAMRKSPENVTLDDLPQTRNVPSSSAHTSDFQIPGTGPAGTSQTMQGSRSSLRSLELQPVVSELWEAALAPKTKVAYQSGFNTYIRFLLLSSIISHAKIPELPVTEELLILFVAHCTSRLKLAYSTIKLYICGIRFLCMQHNIDFPIAAHLSRLRAILGGVKRRQVNTPKARHPVTIDILQKVCLLLRQGVFGKCLDLLMETVCTVAFFGFLRCGEFTVNSNFDHTSNLCTSDMLVLSDLVKLTLRRSKTDPFREGVEISLFKTGNNVCPHRICCKYVEGRRGKNPSPTDPLFVNEKGVALSRSSFISMFKHILDRLGIDSSCYNGHSFRIGAATTAAAVHVEDHIIKRLGRWNSDSYDRYIRTPQDAIREAQQKLAAPSYTNL